MQHNCGNLCKNEQSTDQQHFCHSKIRELKSVGRRNLFSYSLLRLYEQSFICMLKRLQCHALCMTSGWSWWRHQMETFSALLALCAGNSPVTGEFSAQRQVTQSFDIYFDLRLTKRLSKQSRGWWFETPSRSSWRHRNDGSSRTYQNNQSRLFRIRHTCSQLRI